MAETAVDPSAIPGTPVRSSPDGLAGLLRDRARPRPTVATGELAFDVDSTELPSIASGLGAAGWRFVMLVGLDDRRAGAGFAVEVAFERAASPIVRLRAPLAADYPSYPSIARLLPAALWDERELKDMFGIVPEGHPDPRRLVLHDAYPRGFHPLRHDAPATIPDGPTDRHYVPFAAHGEGVFEVPVGPIHAGVIEPGHFRFSVVGEVVLYLDARLFFTHRGIEKLVEGRSIARALPIVERSCGVCTVAHATAFSHAIERIAGADPPARAIQLRAVLAELERLYNHVGDLGNICAGIGFNAGSSQLGWLRERLLRINESLTGHRYLTGVVVPGGLVGDVPAAALGALPGRLAEVERDLRAAVHLINRTEAVLERFRSTGVLTRTMALDLGTVGVAARASGVEIDLRRDQPTGAYTRLEVPRVESVAGDVAARFHVRAQEALASFELLKQLLGELSAGPVSAPLPPLPAGASALGWAEGPRGASWIWVRIGPDEQIERLHLRSASFANWPSVAAAAPGNLMPDFPLINKSFELCYACTDR